MATEVHSIPAPRTLLERRSGSRLQLLSDRPSPHFADTQTQDKDEATRSARGNFSSPLTFTPLTPILASPVIAPAITSATPSTSGVNLNLAALPPNPVQGSGGGIQHKRSRSTLSRLHIALPEDYFHAQNRGKSITAPTTPVSPLSPDSPHPLPRLRDVVILDGIPVANSPLSAEDVTPRQVDFLTGSQQVSVTSKSSRPRTKSARKSFVLGSDGEDDGYRQQQKREAAAEAKKLERYDDLRRYHALMELLKTEAKYLQDLRILINVCATY